MAKPAFVLYHYKLNSDTAIYPAFPDMDSACREAALRIAQEYGLPLNCKYYMTWRSILRDEQQLTRIYESETKEFRIVVESYG